MRFLHMRVHVHIKCEGEFSVFLAYKCSYSHQVVGRGGGNSMCFLHMCVHIHIKWWGGGGNSMCFLHMCVHIHIKWGGGGGGVSDDVFIPPVRAGWIHLAAPQAGTLSLN